jgi:hypothetical protein
MQSFLKITLSSVGRPKFLGMYVVCAVNQENARKGKGFAGLNAVKFSAKVKIEPIRHRDYFAGKISLWNNPCDSAQRVSPEVSELLQQSVRATARRLLDKVRLCVKTV